MSPEIKPDSLLNAEGLRFDGRRVDELRPIQMEVGVLKTADGSASIRQGKTYILAAVYGPRELHPRHLTLNDRAYLRVVYRMATFSVPDRDGVETGFIYKRFVTPIIKRHFLIQFHE